MKMPTAKKLPSGKWRAQVMVDGERVSVTADTEKEAVAQAVAIKAGMMEKQKKPDKLTLDEAILGYEAIRENVLSPATIRGYEIVRKNRFKDLMQKDIYKLTKRDIQKAVDAETAFASPKTIANAYGLIRSVLKDHDIDVFGVKLPQKMRQKKTYLSTADIAKFIDAARGDDCEIPMVMAVWLGLRRSEIVGLCWDCVDFNKNTIEIKRTMVPNKDNKFVLKDGAKNEGSQRTIKCPAYIMDKLKEMHHGQAGRVFNVSPETVRRHTHRICEKAGIPDTTVHGLRHTNAAVMVALNITDKYAMARGGWTTENTFKQIYAYVFPEGASQADDIINSFFEGMIE
jgi:integrase